MFWSRQSFTTLTYIFNKLVIFTVNTKNILYSMLIRCNILTERNRCIKSFDALTSRKKSIYDAQKQKPNIFINRSA